MKWNELSCVNEMKWTKLCKWNESINANAQITITYTPTAIFTYWDSNSSIMFDLNQEVIYSVATIWVGLDCCVDNEYEMNSSYIYSANSEDVGLSEIKDIEQKSIILNVICVAWEILWRIWCAK